MFFVRCLELLRICAEKTSIIIIIIIILCSCSTLQNSFFTICLTEKANRLKAAKKEADTEINNYKTERERQYKEYEARVDHSLQLLFVNSGHIYFIFKLSIQIVCNVMYLHSTNHHQQLLIDWESAVF